MHHVVKIMHHVVKIMHHVIKGSSNVIDFIILKLFNYLKIT